MTAPMPTITLEELAALEKLANERLGSKGVYVNVTIYARTLQQLCAAARRGGEADAHVKYADEQYGNCMNDLQNTKRRAERLESELAALKVERGAAYEGRKNAFTLLDAEVKLRQQAEADLGMAKLVIEQKNEQIAHCEAALDTALKAAQEGK